MGLLWLTACFPSSGRRQVDTTLVIASRGPSTLDPIRLRDVAGTFVARQIYDTLVGYDPKTYALIPRLASSWEALDGGTRFVFTLREGASFLGGREILPDDVVFSLNRLAAKSSGSHLAFLLSEVAGFEAANVTGAEPALSGLRALDDRRFEIRLVAPWFDFPYVLTNPATSPIPKQEYKADPGGFFAAPQGAGAFALSGRYEKGKDLTLKRSSSYWGKRPEVSSARLVIYDQLSSAWEDFGAGRVDIAEAPPGELGLARAEHGERGFGPLATAVYLGVHVRSPKLVDPRFRQAVSLAIDRESIAAAFEGALVPATGLVPTDIPGRSRIACGNLCTRDEALAQDLITEVFGAQPPALGFDFPVGTQRESFASILISNLARVGVEVVPRPAELPEFIDAVGSGSADLFYVGWTAEYPSVDWFITPLFRSGSVDNQTGYRSEATDSAIAAARATENRPDRLAMYRNLEIALTREMALIPIGFFRAHTAAHERISDFYVDLMGGFDLERLTFDAP